MEQAEDWRYENAKRLMGATFSARTYQKPSDEWDHEHCVGCWQKFAESGEPPDVIQAGYVTSNDAWICPECFADLHVLLKWSLETSNSASCEM